MADQVKSAKSIDTRSERSTVDTTVANTWRLLHHLKACIDEQEQEIQKAVINRSGSIRFNQSIKGFRKQKKNVS